MKLDGAEAPDDFLSFAIRFLKEIVVVYIRQNDPNESKIQNFFRKTNFITNFENFVYKKSENIQQPTNAK